MMRYLCLLMICSAAAGAQSDVRLEKLLSLSGLEGVVSSYPGQLSMQFSRAGVSGPDEATRQQARQQLLDTYNNMDVTALLRRYVTTELDADDIEAILSWFESPLGYRLVQAEQQTGSVAGVKAMRAYMARLDQAPPDIERTDLMRRLVQVAHLPTINLSVIRIMLETELLAVNWAMDKAERLSGTQLTKIMGQQFYAMQGMIMPGLTQRMEDASYYTLREFNNAEIQSYINFLNSAAGRRLIAVYERVPVYMFAEIIRRAGMDVPEGFLHLP